MKLMKQLKMHNKSIKIDARTSRDLCKRYAKKECKVKG